MPFLMTWKPEGWPYENIRRMLERYEADGTVTEPWRVSAFRQITVGDRVWLLRQGKEKRGIFGMGDIAGEPALSDYQGTPQMMVPVRFLKLVDPEKRLLIRHGELVDILDRGQIATQSSGVTIRDEQSRALEGLVLGDSREREGADWTNEEMSALVADYFTMLRAEIQSRPYSKTEHRKALLKTVKRSEGAIERKHQNVSAVLHRLGFRWIDGYKPLGNIQKAIVPEISRYLSKLMPDLDSVMATTIPKVVRASDFIVPPPISSRDIDAPDIIEPVARKFDVAKRDARNKALGQCGEEFVVALEKVRLAECGLADIAENVAWASKDEGDGLGYDIRSFADDGTEIFIEVKTTRGDITAPFYLTERERAVAARKGKQFRLYRVFAFGREPKVFIVNGPLDTELNLRPTAYRATVRSPQV